MNEQVNNESTTTNIARQLRRGIMTGAFAPGTQLTESALAAEFNVSRGPLREAMQRLVSEGLLRSERHRGLFVMDLEPTDVYDIYAARAAVEGAAARQIVNNPTIQAEVLDELRKALEAMDEAAAAQDAEALAEADFRFHEALVAASGSKRLIRMSGTLLVETRMCLAALKRSTQHPHDRVAEHRRIYFAVQRGEEQKALEYLEAHMDDALARLAPGSSLRSGPARAEDRLRSLTPRPGRDIE